jgi:hypothetical protein
MQQPFLGVFSNGRRDFSLARLQNKHNNNNNNNINNNNNNNNNSQQ